MQRIEPVNQAAVAPKTAELLDAVKKQMGGVPNILATMAQSSAALGGYLGFAGALAAGTLSAQLREQIALAVAGANQCDYCASVHTTVGGMVGLSAEELAANLRGRSSDRKVSAALSFVRHIVATRGHVGDAELSAVRGAGFSDEEIVEIIANTALNIFTNYFNHVARTEIDFPVVDTTAVEAA
ncbi:MAG: carboxymuconolactone decarboxylase family protein [Alphaproteobacteria bacterium]|nr:MAG: carboxymuconolactone decarboxylase family protein [Alphaproteobacteria bacterium]